MKILNTIILIFLAQHFLNWGNWIWWLFGGLCFVMMLISLSQDK